MSVIDPDGSEGASRQGSAASGSGSEPLDAAVRRLRAENRALRRSVRYRLGDALVRAARNPVRLLLLPGTIARIALRGRASSHARVEVAAPAREPLRPVVLFFAINGVGLGHLTRALAIARHLTGTGLTPIFVTTCKRARVLDDYGISYHYVPTFDELDRKGLFDRKQWNRLIMRTMRGLYESYRPVALVADSVPVYPGIVKAWRQFPEIGRVVVRRAYKTEGRVERVLARDAEAHRIVIPHAPGEIEVPVPPGVPADWIGPVVIENVEEALSREEARAALGVAPEDRCVLLQLGAGVLGPGKTIERALVERLTAKDVRVVVTSYDPVVARAGEGGVIVTHRYPMARYLAAFDAAVAAPGYNTFSELIHHGVPTIFLPNRETLADDQVGRAARAAEAGAAFVGGDDPDEVIATLLALLEDAELRARTAAAARSLIPTDGSIAAARVLERFCHERLEEWNRA